VPLLCLIVDAAVKISIVTRNTTKAQTARLREIMKLKIAGKLIGVILILAAIWCFDPNSWNQIAVSAALFLSGLNSLFADAESESLRKTGKFLLRIALIIAVLLVFKILFLG
jgi:hypothetical protein